MCALCNFYVEVMILVCNILYFCKEREKYKIKEKVFKLKKSIVDSLTGMSAYARDFCKSLADTLGFFFTSLSSLRCALAVIFTGQPLLGRVAAVLNFLHL